MEASALLGGTFENAFSFTSESETFGMDYDSRTMFGKLEDTMISHWNQFTEAPMDYVADAMRNPLVSTAFAFTGLSAIPAGIMALDAGMDLAQGESTAMQAASQALSAAISSPLGAALGQFQGLAASIAGNPSEAGTALGGFVGGKLGGTLGSALASGFSNPYAGAAVAATAGVLGAFGGKQLGSAVQGSIGTSASGPTGIGGSNVGAKGNQQGGKGKTSPLVTGPTQQSIEADATALARTIDLKLPDQVFNPYVGGIYHG